MRTKARRANTQPSMLFSYPMRDCGVAYKRADVKAIVDGIQNWLLILRLTTQSALVAMPGKAYLLSPGIVPDFASDVACHAALDVPRRREDGAYKDFRSRARYLVGGKVR